MAMSVDDYVITSKRDKQLQQIWTELDSSFKIKHLGIATNFFGVQVEMNDEMGILNISQRDYVQSLLETFSMHNSKGVDTPMAREQQQRGWSKQLDVTELKLFKK